MLKNYLQMRVFFGYWPDKKLVILIEGIVLIFMY
jgi:hypothetical protein